MFNLYSWHMLRTEAEVSPVLSGYDFSKRTRMYVGFQRITTDPNGAGTEVGVLADLGVADIAQVWCFGAGGELRFFELDEVADARILGKFGAGTQARIGPDDGAARYMAPFEMRKRTDARAGFDGGGTDGSVAKELILCAHSLNAGDVLLLNATGSELWLDSLGDSA